MKKALPDAETETEVDFNDDTLVLAVLRGDARSFDVLYARHRRYVLTCVTKLLGAGPDREDVIQDVFLQLYRALPSFRGDASLSTFLRRITMNVAFDHLRRRCRHQRVDYDSDALDAAVDARQDPEQHSSARQQLQSLLHHLDGIALDKRRALMLVAVAGLSLNQAAAQLGTNAERVKQRVVRARRELTAMAARSPSSQRPRRIDAQ
jgi:RNA polymerase sigma-70 factor, ECF subfamily